MDGASEQGDVGAIPRLVRDHLGLFVTGLAAGATAIRLAAVSAFDRDTTFALLQLMGPGNVLIGTLVSLIPLFFCLAMAVFVVAFTAGQNHKRRSLFLGAAVVSALIAGWSAPAALFIVYLVLPLLALWREARRQARATTPKRPRETDLIPTVMTALLVVVTLVGYPPWMPREVIVQGGVTHVGYTLRSDQDSTDLLTLTSRQVVHIQGELDDRHICTSRSAAKEGFVAALTVRSVLPRPNPDYPVCPDEPKSDRDWAWLNLEW